MKEAIDAFINPVLVQELFHTRGEVKVRLAEALAQYLCKVSAVILSEAAAHQGDESDDDRPEESYQCVPINPKRSFCTQDLPLASVCNGPALVDGVIG